MKKLIRVAAAAWLLPIIAGCATGDEGGPTMAEPLGSARLNGGFPAYDTVPSEDAVTTAADSLGAERGGGSYGSGH